MCKKEVFNCTGCGTQSEANFSECSRQCIRNGGAAEVAVIDQATVCGYCPDFGMNTARLTEATLRLRIQEFLILSAAGRRFGGGWKPGVFEQRRHNDSNKKI